MTRNVKEAGLIAEAKEAILNYEKADDREGGTYFEYTCVPVFQNIATRTAALIEDQGVAATDKRILKIAEKVKALGKVGYDHANSLGFAFKKALGKEGKKNTNPFTNLRM